MITKKRIIESLTIQIGVFIVNVPLYVLWIIIANKYSAYKWEIIVGFVYYILLCAIEEGKAEHEKS